MKTIEGWGLRTIAEGLADLMFPRSCLMCGGTDDVSGNLLCVTCLEALPWIAPPVCSCCGIPSSALPAGNDSLCGKCLIDPSPCDRVRYSVRYRDSIREAITHYKYGRDLTYGPALAEILTTGFHNSYEPSEIDMIVPIPMTYRRLYRRGFNQAAELARRLGRAVEIPVELTALAKIEDTPPQVGLKLEERRTNVIGSFGVSRKELITDRNILIVDDVATTGATIHEAAAAIKKAGARSARALVLAMRARE